MELNFNTTINSQDFEQLFAEVQHNEKLDVRANSELRLFYLRGVSDCHFPLDRLYRFLSRNIGAYVFSRSKINRFKIEEDLMSVGLEAMDAMRKNGAPDQRGSGNELGEIMVYSFLESVLKAPKVYSKVELSNVNGGKSKSDGIHIKVIKTGTSSLKYEIVFAASGIVGTFSKAVDDVFEHISDINDDAVDEIKIVDESIFSFPNDDPIVTELKPIITPAPGVTVDRDSAYGIFLGYSLGLDKTRYSSDEYRDLVEKKMVSDLKQYAPYIKKKIRELGLNGRSFYLYVFPFDDAEVDKATVMRKVLRVE